MIFIIRFRKTCDIIYRIIKTDRGRLPRIGIGGNHTCKESTRPPSISIYNITKQTNISPTPPTRAASVRLKFRTRDLKNLNIIQFRVRLDPRRRLQEMILIVVIHFQEPTAPPEPLPAPGGARRSAQWDAVHAQLRAARLRPPAPPPAHRDSLYD